ncbi:MAG: SBBP repeat-containing protein [Blastocatellia bacterium]
MTTGAPTIHRAVLLLAFTSLIFAAFPNLRHRAELTSTEERASMSDVDGADSTIATVNKARGHLPVTFEANRGQAEADVKFVGRAPGFGLLLKPGEAVFALGYSKPQSANQREDRSSCNATLPARRLTMRLEGANAATLISGVERQAPRANYFIGNDPAKWIRDVETYSRVMYSSVYPGVDLLFYGNERQLEYDFTVAPGANPQNIRLRFDGAESAELSSDGALILRTAAGEVRHERPVAYQDSGSSRTSVTAEFKQQVDGTIGFRIGAYDTSIPLVIDPVLVYSTYVGGAVSDFGRGIAVDSAGNAYVAGDSVSSDFLFRASPTNADVFVGKLSSNGLLLEYTFFGGSGNDFATGLTVDSAGNVYMCGHTESANFPQLNSFGSALLGKSDAFVVKLSPDNNVPPMLIFAYSSLIGGSGAEDSVSVAADSAGSAYISGRTSSLDYPIAGPIQPVYGGGDTDAFVSKLALDGKTLVYSSLLGGSAAENLVGRSGISVDSLGNAYVVGDTQSINFPAKNALRAAKTGAAATFDGFVAKVNPSGSDFVYSTYLGGTEDDFAFAVAADQTGNAYVTGRTRSTGFTGSGSTRPATGTTDAFVAKLNASGSAISYLTFVGGSSGNESGNSIAIDSAGNAAIAGTAGPGLPAVNSIQSFFKGRDFESDALVAKLGPNGAVILSTYLGGSRDDAALAVGFGSDGAIYITGYTDSTDFLTAAPLVRDNKGGRDIFIAKIDPNATSDRPVLLQATVSGKHLLVFGLGFDAGAVLRINDEPTKTRNEDPAPTQILFAKKAAKRIAPGQTVQLQIENANGKRSNLLFFTKPL